MHRKRISIGYGKKPKWIVTPMPGAHRKDESIPLLLVIRDILKYANTAKEANFILNNGMILVDKKVRKDPKFAVGLMDVIEIPKANKYFRVMPSEKGLTLKEIEKKESNFKLYKVINKKILKKKAIQLNLSDGSNVLIKDPKEDIYKTKDTVVLELLPEKKIQNKIEFKKGNIALITKGIHSGRIGKISDITEGTQTKKSITVIDDNIKTLTDYIFVIGEKEPIISL